ncbi:MAG: SMI1/KNR4 family protein [Sphingobacterium sp.]|jgi:cell wall assembly regulator SMI1|uniref:SMI1/KNR4 family protein n=1 Tax=unclassified Sphingobacterium TaxID=2609468 RepID=UPI002845CCBA|nr:SMI1/KNR4 family protein [Sphingobacterium sp.]MDR3009676.1 SMI1/KNR4 family protein [Sphingobacterium sp.]
MKIADNYLSGLKKAYYENGGKETWDHFEQIKHGASTTDLEKLKEIFPAAPQGLIDLLEYVDGTYWRTYADEEIAFFFLGSDLNEYPYYLLSSKEMIDNQHIAHAYYADYIDRKYDHVEIDNKITDQSTDLKWLHFSDCMNNGGTSQLFVDFSPSGKGKKGQIVRFVHDPDEFRVIADSFDEYLELLINTGFNFIDEEDMY